MSEPIKPDGIISSRPTIVPVGIANSAPIMGSYRVFTQDGSTRIVARNPVNADGRVGDDDPSAIGQVTPSANTSDVDSAT